MVAYTGAAGKYDPQAPMSGNEDNFYVDDNLSDDVPSHCSPDEIIKLEDCGLIMAVCDGMGGMNAGEIASAIAVNTIKEAFAPGKISTEIANSAKGREEYLEKIIVEADRRIKEDAKHNREHEGMGSTIILAWIVNDEMTVTWCGDSRAYRFNPEIGLRLLSEDHSYVQDLVKQGVLAYEDTFDHPQGNIITRSLGEQGKKAKPETRHYHVYKNDVILLCSDGLSGVLRDKKTQGQDGNYYLGENIEDIIKANTSSMMDCKNALWDAAERADWYDNVTILLCQIVEGPEYDESDDENNKKNINGSDSNNLNGTIDINDNNRNFWNNTLHLNVRYKPKHLFFAVIVVVITVVSFFLFKNCGDVKNGSRTLFAAEKDSLQQLLIKGQSRFMGLAGITFCGEYFQAIKSQIESINDSISFASVRVKVDNFMDNLQKKTLQLEMIDEKIKDNPGKKQKLEGLKEECISQPLSEEDVAKKIDHIIKGNVVDEAITTVDTSKSRNIQKSDKDKTLTKDSTNSLELTPVSIQNEISVDFSAKNSPNHIVQIDSIKQEYTNQGYQYVGLFEGDEKVTIKNIVAKKTYVIKFRKNNSQYKLH